VSRRRLVTKPLRLRPQAPVEFRARANAASIERAGEQVRHQGNAQSSSFAAGRAYIMDVVPSFHVRPFRRLQSGFVLGVL
jgi:hypothetical protein